MGYAKSYTCPQCNTPLPDGSKFCHVCGGGVSTEPACPSSCPSCYASLQPGSAFCPACGRALGAAGAAPRSPGAYAAPWPVAQAVAGKPTSARVAAYAFSPLLMLLVFAVGKYLAVHTFARRAGYYLSYESYENPDVMTITTVVLGLFGLLLWAMMIVDANLLLEKDGYVRSRRLLEEHGYSSGALRAWAILLVPVYMYKRAKLLGTGQSHFATFLIMAAIYVIGAIVTTALAK